MKAPPLVERIVALLLPPQCREHVLGDLAERNRSGFAYLADAAAALPCVIYSQMRRLGDPLRDLAEAGLLYLATMAVAGVWHGSGYLLEPGMPARLAAPALAAFASLFIARVYGRPYEIAPAYLLSMAAAWWMNLPQAIPQFGSLAGFALIFVLRKFLSSGEPPRHVTR